MAITYSKRTNFFLGIALLFSACSKNTPNTDTPVTTNPIVKVTLIANDLKDPTYVAVDKLGSIYVTEEYSRIVTKISVSGTRSTIVPKLTAYTSPEGLAIDATGNVFFVDDNQNNVREYSSGGILTTFAGGSFVSIAGTMKGLKASFYTPTALTIDATGNIFVSDTQNNLIRKITPDTTVTIFAGKYGTQSSVDGTGTNASFSQPSAITIDPMGNLYVVDGYYKIIRKITPAGVVTTIPGFQFTLPNISLGPCGIVSDSNGNIFISDTASGRIYKMSTSGTISIYVDHSSIVKPNGLAIDSKGNLFVTDSDNNSLYEVSVN